MESNDSPEIPDRGETSDIPGLPSGGGSDTETDRNTERERETKRFFKSCTVYIALQISGINK